MERALVVEPTNSALLDAYPASSPLPLFHHRELDQQNKVEHVKKLLRILFSVVVTFKVLGGTTEVLPHATESISNCDIPTICQKFCKQNESNSLREDIGL